MSSLFQEPVFVPECLRVNTRVEGNWVRQLEFTGRTEQFGVLPYASRGVEGWELERHTGEKWLVVGRKSGVSGFDKVLLIPDAVALPRVAEELPVEGVRWLQSLAPASQADLEQRCQQVLDSWAAGFRLQEETPAGQPGLREPQLGALYAALSHWTVSGEPATIVMPTGTGKTETMLALFARKRLKRLLVVVPTSALRDQISRKFLTMGVLPRLGMFSSSEPLLPIVGLLNHRLTGGVEARRFVQSCNVVVATMTALGGSSGEARKAIAEECSHLFFDEAHHVPANTWNELKTLFEEVEKPVLQFTATPFRRDGKHVQGKSIFVYPLRRAQADGYFTKINFVSLWEYDPAKGDLAVATRALAALRADIEKGYDHILMARAESIDRADSLYRDIYSHLAADLNPILVHSDLTHQLRSEALAKLLSRGSKVVICVDMLGEGFDLPQLKVAALHDVHKSLTVTLQFAGRFTRVEQGLGEATIVANAGMASVEMALEDLYSKDSDWNFLLQRLSEGATDKQRRQTAFIEGFQNPDGVFPLSGIRPKMSTVAYKTQCADWRPEGVKPLLKGLQLLISPTINPVERVLLYVVIEGTPVAWGDSKAVKDFVHHLYLIHWDESQRLLFINSTNKKSTYKDIAQAVAGPEVELVRGELIYRSLHGIKRLILSNLGLLHALNRATQFTMHVGSDVASGLSQANISNRRKSNLFGRGFEAASNVTIGASYKGRVWSQRVAKDIQEWVEWARVQGQKLLDSTISTEKILQHAIVPTVVTERPQKVPLQIDWPIEFFKRNDEVCDIIFGEDVLPFREVDLRIAHFASTGSLSFILAHDDLESEYEVVFRDRVVDYVRRRGPDVFVKVSKTRKSLNEWFQDETPTITFADTSVLDYNEVYIPQKNWSPYPPDRIALWDWSGVSRKTESQYKGNKKTGKLDHRANSVQRRVLDTLIADAADFDVIFDDDFSGEVADIVVLKAAGDQLIIRLVHCKWSKEDAGLRVGDLYEVCGQAQKSVRWRSDIKKLFERLTWREKRRQTKYGLSRFEKGDQIKLDELRRRSRALYPSMEVWIVQPGLALPDVENEILDLLGCTALYLKETFDVELTVVGSISG